MQGPHDGFPRKAHACMGKEAYALYASAGASATPGSTSSTSSTSSNGGGLLSLPRHLLQGVLLSLPGGSEGGAAGAVCACRELHTAWAADLGRPEVLAIHLRARHGGDVRAALTYVYRNEGLRGLLLRAKRAAGAGAGASERSSQECADARADVLLKLAVCLQPPPPPLPALPQPPPSPQRRLRPHQQLPPRRPRAQAGVRPAAAAAQCVCATMAAAAAEVVRAAACPGVDDGGVVRSLLQRHPGCCSPSELDSLLLQAARHGRVGTAAALLDCGAQPAALARMGWDPAAALRAGHAAVVELLLFRDGGRAAPPALAAGQLLRLFCVACRFDAAGVVRHLLRAAADADWLHQAVQWELVGAARRGSVPVVEALLEGLREAAGEAARRAALCVAYAAGFHKYSPEVAAALLRAGAGAHLPYPNRVCFRLVARLMVSVRRWWSAQVADWVAREWPGQRV